MPHMSRVLICMLGKLKYDRFCDMSRGMSVTCHEKLHQAILEA
jgi:hypothetical protein